MSAKNWSDRSSVSDTAVILLVARKDDRLPFQAGERDAPHKEALGEKKNGQHRCKYDYGRCHLQRPVCRSERVFELRTYTATEGHLDNLNARFRDHTLKLFEKHDMTNWVYWNYLKGTKGDDAMLVYFLTHASQDAAKKSFGSFGKDPEWVTARKASEEKAGGSLTAAKDGVKSVFLKPTDYSPTK